MSTGEPCQRPPWDSIHVADEAVLLEHGNKRVGMVCGFAVVTDPKVPPGWMHVCDREGRVVDRVRLT